MRKQTFIIAIALIGLTMPATAQTILSFDFDNAPIYTSLPIDVVVGGVTAHLSATGQGYSIQSTSTAPVVPVGFSGRFIYPNSVFPADLRISFSHTVTSFSIRYSPQELGCDDSARMRVTAYMNASVVGTNTTTAPNPGTWPVGTLACSFLQGFDVVVVHYDAHPPTCSDYGPIFLADDMSITVPIAATAVPVGSGCGSMGAPVLSSTPPKIGQLVSFSLAQGTQLTFGEIYYSGIPSGSTALGSGCFAYLDVLTATPLIPVLTNAGGAWSSTYPVPFDLSLVGVQLVLQVALYATPSPIGFDVSSAVLVSIGY